MSDSQDLRELEKDPRLFLYTSLTAGSSHIITATSRLETILKANKVPFLAIDVATDEKARRLWQRRAGKRKLPGLVKDGFVLGDLEEVEEWNEYGELKENIGTLPPAGTSVPAPKLPVIPTATAGTTTVTAPDPLLNMPKRVALPGAAEIAARNNPLTISSPEEAAHPETMSSAPAEKEKSIEKAIKFKGEQKDIEHVTTPSSAIAAESPSLISQPDKVESKPDASREVGDDTTTNSTASERSQDTTEADTAPAVSEDKGPPEIAGQVAAIFTDTLKVSEGLISDVKAAVIGPASVSTSEPHQVDKSSASAAATSTSAEPKSTDAEPEKTTKNSEEMEKADISTTKVVAAEESTDKPVQRQKTPAEDNTDTAAPPITQDTPIAAPGNEASSELPLRPAKDTAHSVAPAETKAEKVLEGEVPTKPGHANLAETADESTITAADDVPRTQKQAAAEPELAAESVGD